MRPNRELATPTLVAPVALRALAAAAEPYGPAEYAEPLAELPQPAAIRTAAKGAAAAMNTVILLFMGVPFSGSCRIEGGSGAPRYGGPAIRFGSSTGRAGRPRRAGSHRRLGRWNRPCPCPRGC